MTVALPLPYRDELLYSVIGRYMEAASVELPTAVIRRLFGRLVFPRQEMLVGLGTFATETRDTWGLTALDIASRHTVLPYYLSHTSAEKFSSICDAVNSDGGIGPTVLLGLSAARVERTISFRYCRQCVELDSRHQNETYWRRAHQLPGVFVCFEHSEMLRITSSFKGVSSSREWRSADFFLEECKSDNIGNSHCYIENPDVLSVMRSSVELLDSTESILTDDAHERYRSMAEAAGLTKLSGIIDTEAIRHGMIAMYGDDYLRAVGLPIHPAPTQGWASAMMNRSRSTHQPLQHLLLKHFLLSIIGRKRAVSEEEVLTERRIFRCPNEFAVHGENHPIDHVKIDQGIERRIGRGHCSCGLKFSFTRCSPGTRTPEICRVYAFGSDWCEAAQRMRRDGLSLVSISARMGVSRDSVKCLLKQRRLTSSVGPSRQEILGIRSSWKYLLAEVAPGGHKAAKSKNPSLYYYLNRYDKSWLRNSAKIYVKARNSRAKVSSIDWAARDRDWTNELLAAAQRLRERSEPTFIRASRTAIVAEANVYILHPSVMHKLPLCAALLKAESESVEQFQIRRLKAVAARMRTNGESIVGWKILKRAAVPTSRVTQRIQVIVGQLVSGTGENL